jgi:hypothetical protein
MMGAEHAAATAANAANSATLVRYSIDEFYDEPRHHRHCRH